MAVSTSDKHIVGLKSDGTVVVTRGEINVDSWTDIVAVCAGAGDVVGVKSDGTVVAVSDNRFGEQSVKNWTGMCVEYPYLKEK